MIDLIFNYQTLPTAYDMWAFLKEKFNDTIVTKLRQLTIKFDTYKKCPNHTIKEHLRTISNMLKDLKTTSHILTNE